MSPKKLSDADKQEIIELYRTSPETTSTLADRYGVSSSTISRFLKSYFSESEYVKLIQHKRLMARSGVTQDLVKSFEHDEIPEPEALAKSFEYDEIPEPEELVKSFEYEQAREPEELVKSFEYDEIPEPEELVKSFEQDEIPEPEDLEENRAKMVDVITLNEMLGEDLEDEDDEDDEDDYEEDEDWEEQTSDFATQILTHGRPQVEVLPLSEAYFPKVCYVVIDRFAELITRPLQEFADLGKIPLTEIQQKTLPIFDNQKVARRFSNRSQRVIKVPDGRLFKKTSGYLKAKGITRLLIDGQVYAC